MRVLYPHSGLRPDEPKHVGLTALLAGGSWNGKRSAFTDQETDGYPLARLRASVDIQEL
jgi:hypothetical protein